MLESGAIMCCTIKKTKGKSLTTRETKIYTKEVMLQEAEKKKDTEALFFEYGSLKFCILYTKNYFVSAGLSQLAFYTMSKGLEAYTETGYKSNFVHSGESAGIEDVEEFFKLKLNERGIDLDNPKPLILSDVGGTVRVVQPSLF